MQGPTKGTQAYPQSASRLSAMGRSAYATRAEKSRAGFKAAPEMPPRARTRTVMTRATPSGPTWVGVPPLTKTQVTRTAVPTISDTTFQKFDLMPGLVQKTVSFTSGSVCRSKCLRVARYPIQHPTKAPRNWARMKIPTLAAVTGMPPFPMGIPFRVAPGLNQWLTTLARVIEGLRWPPVRQPT